nr:hypothetical protein [Tanacetum cinerariifolium]
MLPSSEIQRTNNLDLNINLNVKMKHRWTQEASCDDPLVPQDLCHTVGSGEDRMEHEIVLTDPVPQTSHDPPLLGGHTPGSDEGSMTQNELTDLYTTLLQKVLDLENVKTAQAKAIASLKKKGRKNLKSQQKFQDIDDLVDEGMNFDLDNDANIEMIVKDKDVTIADTLVKMKNQKAKEKEIAFKDADDSARPIRSITTLQPLPTIDPKDKCKCILQ